MAETTPPQGYNTVTPYLTARGVARLIDFITQVFGAKVHERIEQPDGRVVHAELKLGESMIMLGEPTADVAPLPCGLHVYVADTDATYRKALAAGATSMMAPADQFYGDRSAGVKDTWGNVWWIATRKETLSAEEVARRAAKQAKPRA